MILIVHLYFEWCIGHSTINSEYMQVICISNVEGCAAEIVKRGD